MTTTLGGAMKMKGQLNVETPAEYIAAVDERRRSADLDEKALVALIKETAKMGLVV